jgi:hypothetical protein
MRELIDWLKKHQQDEGLKDADYAAKFGIARERWLAIKANPRKLGDKTLGLILLAYKDTRFYKELKELIIIFLEEKITTGK